MAEKHDPWQAPHLAAQDRIDELVRERDEAREALEDARPHILQLEKNEQRARAEFAEAEAEQLREALREISKTPTGCLAGHARIADAALPPSTGEHEPCGCQLTDSGSGADPNCPIHGSSPSTGEQGKQDRWGVIHIPADGLSEGQVGGGDTHSVTSPRGSDLHEESSRDALPLAESECPNCGSKKRSERLPVYNAQGERDIPCEHPWHTCPTCGSDDPTWDVDAPFSDRCDDPYHSKGSE